MLVPDTLRSRLPRSIHHQGCSKKLPYLEDSNRLPSVFITGKSAMNTNNSTNIGRNYLMKKTGVEISRDSIPSTCSVDFMENVQLVLEIL